MKITVGIGKPTCKKTKTPPKADRVTLVKKLLNLCDELEYDMDRIRERDPAARNNLEVALLYSGFHAVTAHRLSHYLHNKGYRLTARALSQFVKMLTGIEIHPGATIGKGLFIDHGSGVVIGETAVIGDDCTLYQGVTLGGTGKECGKRHPTLGNHVMVGAGAKVLGPFRVGDHAKIAAGAVVLKEIPENSTAVGIPAKVVRLDGEVVEELDQVNIPDPIAKELAELREAIAVLKERMK
ncbi:MAG: serine O-acetyltransferase [Clostridia bacterium]|nr:serine O-acetyltransferase [Clostridia bacterium]